MEKLEPHINLKRGDISPLVLFPGDPARVRRIAEFLDDPKEIVNNRGYLGINGSYKGVLVTAFSSGMGCPSAAIALEELVNIGAKVFIRIGTCGGLKKEIEPGNLIIPERALRHEGTTAEYVDTSKPSIPAKELFNSLVDCAKELNYTYFTGVNRTHDAFYESIENFLKLTELSEYKDGSLVGSEMECSAVFTIAELRKVKSAAILSVNTAEPLDEIAEDPNLIYYLETSPKAKQGVDNAIKVALEAIVKYKDKN